MHSSIRSLAVGLVLFSGIAAPSVHAQTPSSEARYTLYPAHSSIQFSIGHFFVSSTDGAFTSFDGRLTFPQETPERGTASIHVSPGSIDTGIAARDDHLRTADFFDIARFPQASFESSGLTLTGGSNGRLKGLLTVHGVTQPITLDVTLQTPDRTGERLAFSAQGKLKRSAFGMNQFAGVIGDEVTLKIAAQFVRMP